MIVGIREVQPKLVLDMINILLTEVIQIKKPILYKKFLNLLLIENATIENKNNMSRASANRSSHPDENRTAVFTDTLAQEEKEMKQQQKVLLGQEYIKQLKEKEMMRDIERDKVF